MEHSNAGSPKGLTTNIDSVSELELFFSVGFLCSFFLKRDNKSQKKNYAMSFFFLLLPSFQLCGRFLFKNYREKLNSKTLSCNKKQ